MITLDTSAVLAFLDARDADHDRVAPAIFEDPGPCLLPVATLGEIAYVVERRWGWPVLDAFLRDVEAGPLTYECGDFDLPRARELARRYEDLPLGFVDAAAVIACAKRNGGGCSHSTIATSESSPARARSRSCRDRSEHGLAAQHPQREVAERDR